MPKPQFEYGPDKKVTGVHLHVKHIPTSIHLHVKPIATGISIDPSIKVRTQPKLDNSNIVGIESFNEYNSNEGTEKQQEIVPFYFHPSHEVKFVGSEGIYVCMLCYRCGCHNDLSLVCKKERPSKVKEDSTVNEHPTDEKSQGILSKYHVQRLNDPTGKHNECRYFVLDPQHDVVARVALDQYAYEARTLGYYQLANDISAWLDNIRAKRNDPPYPTHFELDDM